eukprot:516133-Prymnesium_polylepis.1
MYIDASAGAPVVDPVIRNGGKIPAGILTPVLRCLQSDAHHYTIRDRSNAQRPGAAHYIPSA